MLALTLFASALDSTGRVLHAQTPSPPLNPYSRFVHAHDHLRQLDSSSEQVSRLMHEYTVRICPTRLLQLRKRPSSLQVESAAKHSMALELLEARFSELSERIKSQEMMILALQNLLHPAVHLPRETPFRAEARIPRRVLPSVVNVRYYRLYRTFNFGGPQGWRLDLAFQLPSDSGGYLTKLIAMEWTLNVPPRLWFDSDGNLPLGWKIMPGGDYRWSTDPPHPFVGSLHQTYSRAAGFVPVPSPDLLDRRSSCVWGTRSYI